MNMSDRKHMHLKKCNINFRSKTSNRHLSKVMLCVCFLYFEKAENKQKQYFNSVAVQIIIKVQT